MKIVVDTQGLEALQALLDLALKVEGIKAMDFVTQVSNSIKVEQPPTDSE